MQKKHDQNAKIMLAQKEMISYTLIISSGIPPYTWAELTIGRNALVEGLRTQKGPMISVLRLLDVKPPC